MTDSHLITGKAAPLDTDQIMPKQFLRRIDKKGLDKGVLWGLRFDGEGQMRPEFVLNRPEFEGLDMIGASLKFEDEIVVFAQRHWAKQPWVKDVAARTTLRSQ